jgi:hypothetical protein
MHEECGIQHYITTRFVRSQMLQVQYENADMEYDYKGGEMIFNFQSAA